MKYATFSIDRRGEYSTRLAAHIDAMSRDRRNVAWALVEARKAKGRRIQAAIKPKDLQPFPHAEPAPAVIAPEVPAAPVTDITTARKRNARR